MTIVTRFAPSPTGYLHKGHAFSALLAERLARQADGRFLLRIEDIDTTRLREPFVDGIYEDLTWLGLTWEHPVRRQSAHFADYEKALRSLVEDGLAYPCFCTRRDIVTEIEAAGGAPHGPDGPVYPGLCRGLSAAERRHRTAREAHAWRLDMTRALDRMSAPVQWTDLGAGRVRADPSVFGDIVLARKDVPTSYSLAVVHDDALQSVTHVIRGRDLFHHTDVQVLLQHLLGLPTPIYYHHDLVLGPDGQRLAKRDRAETLRALRQQGDDPGALRQSLLALDVTLEVDHPRSTVP